MKKISTGKQEEYFCRTTAVVFIILVFASAYILREILIAKECVGYTSDLLETFPEAAETVLGGIVMYLVFAAIILYRFLRNPQNMNDKNRKSKK